VVKQKIEDFLQGGISPDQIAVVLANEKLLWPVLQQLPETIEQVNITMEYPIKYTPAYSVLESLIQLQHGFSRRGKKLIKEPLFLTFLESKSLDFNPEKVLNEIRKRNISYLSSSLLKELFGKAFPHVETFFEPTSDYTHYTISLINLLDSVSYYLREGAVRGSTALELEFIQLIVNQFTRLQELILLYPHFNQFKGLQVMGLLESRTLDFEYLILVNINEGILPSGKSTNSFLPNDLKRAFGLPLYSEKDAIYAYHFYRLLQRANVVCITYDSETDTFGKGEKSRFVTQLELELPAYSALTLIREDVAGYTQLPEEKTYSIVIQKTDAVMSKIIDKAISNELYKGLSPSSLIAFKECSLRFYYRYSAGLKESEEVEESAESNTMGSILHLSLEALYKDCCGIELIPAILTNKKALVPTIVRNSFASLFDNIEPSGKSLLQEEVIKVYVNKQIKQELESVEKLRVTKKHLRILHLEHELSSKLHLQSGCGIEEVFIKGKADRIDAYGDDFRIIDYKSSVKLTDKFEFVSFDVLFSDERYNKQLQLFVYAWLAFKNKLALPGQIKPCIIAFKHYSEEPEFITMKKTPMVFTERIFEEFEMALAGFVVKIFNRSEAFTQTDDHELCKFCAYNTVCNRF
ncbi:MAG: PD-(D/E)XK nuclease family protein, partial [Bacteroidia bacterium]|nr:PD-(D/E)XK nuclease family protein [Bacteroidia bacterium]